MKRSPLLIASASSRWVRPRALRAEATAAPNWVALSIMSVLPSGKFSYVL